MRRWRRYSELDLERRLRAHQSLTQGQGKDRSSFPGDVHTALLAAGEIPDPYFGENEQAVMWVHDTAWTVERTFHRDGRPTSTAT